MKLMTYVLAAFAMLMLAGCAHDVDRMEAYSKDYKVYADNVTTATQALKTSTPRPPLFKLEAQPGQTIELKGVKSLEINAPDVSANNQAAAVQIAPPQPVKGIGAEVWGFVSDTLKTSLPFVAQGIQGWQQMRTTMRASDNSVLVTQSNNATTAAIFNAFGATTSSIAGQGFAAASGIAGQGFAAAATLGSKPSSVVNVTGNNNAVGVQGGSASITTTTTTTVTCPSGTGGNGTGAAGGSPNGTGATPSGGTGGAGTAGASGTTTCNGN